MSYDIVSLVEVRQKLDYASRKRRADPSTLFQQLRAISNQLTVPGKPLDQSYLMAATYEYKVVTSTERRIKGPEPTISDLEVEISELYRQLSRASGRNKGSNSD